MDGSSLPIRLAKNMARVLTRPEKIIKPSPNNLNCKKPSLLLFKLMRINPRKPKVRPSIFLKLSLSSL